MMPEHYVPLDQELVANLDKAVALHELKQFNNPERVDAVLARHSGRSESLRYFPMVARDQDMTVIVNRNSGRVVDIVDLRPWS